MAIYTRTGDKGKTSLRDGKRVLKSDPRVESYGNIDELSSLIGVAIAQVENSKSKSKTYIEIVDELQKIQNDLFEIGANLADPKAKNAKNFNIFLKQRVDEFEKQIDEMTKKLPEITHFILPGGSLFGANIHLCRTFCRRAERFIVRLSQKEVIDDMIVVYLNRLSDFLFEAARLVNFLDKKKEFIWTEKIK